MILVCAMKIVLKKKEDTIKVYHDPREVIVHPKGKQVEIFNRDGTFLENHTLVSKDLIWLDNPNNDTTEILLILVIE